jgi:Flp pilus assembly protein TadD
MLRGRRAAPLLPALALAAVTACSHLPKIIVLEDPLTADEHVTLGVSYERRGELGPAAREYEKALRKDRTSFRAHLNLGNVRLSEKRYEAARAEYLRALELRPADAEATNNLAWVAILSGSGREEALRRLEALVAARNATSPQADGLTPVLLDTRGVLLDRLGRRPEADTAFAQAEAACLALGVPAGPDAPTARCPDAVLEEIRKHREELR